MFTSINVYQFRDAFHNMGRKDQFSYNALGALFDYLEQLEEDCGEPIELDVIALCCEYAEYDSALEAAREYGYTPCQIEEEESEDEYNESVEESALDWLRARKTVIEFSGGVVIQNF